MSNVTPAMSDAVLAELERNATMRCDCGSCDGDLFGLTPKESLALLAETKRARAVEKHLRATVADAAGAIGQDMERDEELARLRKANKDLAKLSMRTMERAAKAEDRLAEIGETSVEWGVQWLDADGEPFGLHWPGKDEAVQTYTRNHLNGNGDAQLLHRLVGQPRVADVEIVSDAPQGLNCWCPHNLMPDGKLVRDGVVAAGCPTHDVEQAPEPRLTCGCLGSCEGGPECLDDEGGPWPQGVPE